VSSFAAFLCENGATKLAASEAAERQFEFALSRIEKLIGRWHGQGLQAPMNLVTDNRVLLAGWSHDRHLEVTGRPSVSSDFIGIYHWISDLDERQFLLPVVCFLKLVD